MLNSKVFLFNILLIDCNGNTVAFHAILSTRLTNVPTNAIIKFGNVLVNEGSGYNPINSGSRCSLIILNFYMKVKLFCQDTNYLVVKKLEQ